MEQLPFAAAPDQSAESSLAEREAAESNPAEPQAAEQRQAAEQLTKSSPDVGQQQATLPRQTERTDKKPKRLPPFHVVLWNDDDHSYVYVIAMLQELFGYPVEKGFQIARQIDTRGRAIVLTTSKEHAELKRDQIHAYGKDDMISSCLGSMSSTIEPSM